MTRIRQLKAWLNRNTASTVSGEPILNNKLLIVDDEEVIIKSIREDLAEEGYEISSAMDGREGLEIYEKEHPALIILDLKMPGMDGIEFLEHIGLKSSDLYSVIVLTGHGEDEDIKSCFSLGVSSFLKKPYNPYMLRGMVRHSLETIRTRQAVIKSRDELEERVEARTKELKTSNERLEHEIAERKQIEEQLKVSLKEKEVLLREVHHRVKNNMQVIISLLRMQSRYISDKQYIDMFKDCQNRIESMVSVHEKLYQSEKLSNINFKDYIKDLADNMFHSYGINTGKIALKMDVSDVSFGVDTAIPCGLVINELISNALKYAFPSGYTQGMPAGKKGEIQISLSRIADLGLRNADLKSEIPDTESEMSEMIELIVSDNGVGMPEDTDFRNTKSLGLQLVTGIVEKQLGGAIEVDRTKGTRITIKFKER